MTQRSAAVLAFLKEQELGGIALLKPARVQASDASVGGFLQAMERAGAVAPAEAASPKVVAAADAAPPAKAVPPVGAPPPAEVAGPASRGVEETSDSKLRARRALGLDAPAAVGAPATGEAILEGLKKLRGVFQDANLRLNAALSSSDGFDPQALMATQLEMINWSLLVEVASKMEGKSTQALNDLLKSG
jgi:Type III secretion basal body protein I, YscI, HrpB, PscI